MSICDVATDPEVSVTCGVVFVFVFAVALERTPQPVDRRRDYILEALVGASSVHASHILCAPCRLMSACDSGKAMNPEARP